MSIRIVISAGRVAVVLGLAAMLGGCAYDYVQRTDRVAYSAGDAVRANIERETSNPSHKGQYNTKGLGRNGHVVDPTPVVALQ